MPYVSSSSLDRSGCPHATPTTVIAARLLVAHQVRVLILKVLLEATVRVLPVAKLNLLQLRDVHEFIN